jgi:hypothetical protein
VITDTVLNEVLDRADRYCEHCGFTRPGGRFALHHRKLRSHGGDDSAVNLMVVTPSHHNVAFGSIHQEVARSLLLGHIVPEGGDPASIPVRSVLELKLIGTSPHGFVGDHTGYCMACNLPEGNARHQDQPAEEVRAF